MQTISDKSPAGARFPLVLVGVAVGIGGVGAALTIAGVDSPLRAPFTLFFLVIAPASALGGALRGLDGAARAVLAGLGALALDLLVAQAMLALHVWSVRGGVLAVGAVSLALFLSARAAHAHRRRTTSSRHTTSSQG
ncbi:hypothetical protein ACWY4P_42575 [Streptomyces sp. LZ34]